MNRVVRLALLFSTLLIAVRAQLTNLAVYAGGENDTTPVNGNIVSSALDTSGNNYHLVSHGVLWSNNASPGSAAFDRGLPSTFSYYFNGVSSLDMNTTVTSATTNWGMETWVNLDSVSGTQIFVLNGQGGDGYGLLLTGGNWSGLLGGVLFLTGSAAVANTWTHLALVNEAGTSTLYVNGVVADSTSSGASTPTSQFSIGTDPADNYMYGYLDQVRVFTFAGSFNTASLNLSSVPEPSTYAAVLGFGALGLAAWRRRRNA